MKLFDIGMVVMILLLAAAGYLAAGQDAAEWLRHFSLKP